MESPPGARAPGRLLPGPRPARAGLRFNPFGTLSAEEFLEATLPGLPPPAPGACARWVAAHGRGKTSCLCHWARALPGARLVRGGREAWPGLSACGALLLDGAETCASLPLREAAAVPTLVRSSHRDLSRALGRPVQTVDLPRLELPWLEALVARRVAFARLGSGPVPEVPRAVLEALLLRHGDDLRALTAGL